jgi:hypothetical protein
MKTPTKSEVDKMAAKYQAALKEYGEGNRVTERAEIAWREAQAKREAAKAAMLKANPLRDCPGSLRF